MNNKETYENTLGDGIHAIRSAANAEVEKTRILTLLEDKNNVAYQRTQLLCLHDKDFEKHSKKWGKNISGFRPTATQYKERAVEIMISGMNRANHIGWYFYEKAYMSYLNENMIELSKMLAQEKQGETKTSDELLKAVIDNAPKYKVTAEDIRNLYESWYFRRTDELHQWLEDLDKLGRSIENQRQINEIRADLETIKKDLLKIDKALDKSGVDSDALQSFEAQVNCLQEEFSNNLELLKESYVKVASEKKEQNKEIETLQLNENKILSRLDSIQIDSEKNAISILDSLNDRIDIFDKKYKTAINNLDTQLNQKLIELKPQPSQEKSHSEKFKNKVIYSELICSNNIHVNEHEFIDNYQKQLELFRIETASPISIFNHCILKYAGVICCSSPNIVDAWIQTLNWKHHVVETAVDPNWTNYKAWQDVAISFLSNPDLRILILHSYNTGYIEGYLKPFLTLFRREHHTHKKIILIESESTPEDFASGIGLTLLDHQPITEFKNFDRVESKNADSISIASFDEWQLIDDEESEDHAHNICQELLNFTSANNIKLLNSELNEIYCILASYLSNKLSLDQKRKELVMRELLSNLWTEELINKLFEEL